MKPTQIPNQRSILQFFQIGWDVDTPTHVEFNTSISIELINFSATDVGPPTILIEAATITAPTSTTTTLTSLLPTIILSHPTALELAIPFLESIRLFMVTT